MSQVNRQKMGLEWGRERERGAKESLVDWDDHFCSRQDALESGNGQVVWWRSTWSLRLISITLYPITHTHCTLTIHHPTNLFFKIDSPSRLQTSVFFFESAALALHTPPGLFLPAAGAASEHLLVIPPFSAICESYFWAVPNRLDVNLLSCQSTQSDVVNPWAHSAEHERTMVELFSMGFSKRLLSINRMRASGMSWAKLS